MRGRCIPASALLRHIGDQVITAEILAAKEQISERTVYRHITRLRREGYQIRSEVGVGYIMGKQPRPEADGKRHRL